MSKLDLGPVSAHSSQHGIEEENKAKPQCWSGRILSTSLCEIWLAVPGHRKEASFLGSTFGYLSQTRRVVQELETWEDLAGTVSRWASLAGEGDFYAPLALILDRKLHWWGRDPTPGCFPAVSHLKEHLSGDS